MSVATLTIHHAAPPERPHVRAQRLLAEARAAADEQVQQLEQALVVVAQLSADVGQGGDVYPPGVRDIAKRISGDAAWCAQTLDSIMMHASGRKPPAADLDAA